MVVRNLMESKIFDENEQVVILKGDVNYPNRLYTGCLWKIPAEILELEIEQVSSMGEHRRTMWNLNKYGWIEIWVG